MRGPLGAQVLPGQQETRGAGIIQFEITEAEMHWMPFAEMNSDPSGVFRLQKTSEKYYWGISATTLVNELITLPWKPFTES